MKELSFPKKITIIRHGQSAANIALEIAEQKGLSNIGIDIRDMDVPLSEIGRRQAAATGLWLRNQANLSSLNIFVSPYHRTKETIDIAIQQLDATSIFPVKMIDERLREREFGLITGLTRKGILEQFPLEVAAYDKIKKFYYRPPGGESWCDVILRVRSLIDSLRSGFADQEILLVGHTVTVYAFRYVLENLTEQEILDIDKKNDLANCSITSFIQDPNSNGMKIQDFNFVEHLKVLNEPVTRKSDVTKI